MKTAFFYTLGCKVNQYETEVLRRMFAAQGYGTCPEGKGADLVVINSCTVTATGDKKTLRLLRRMRKDHPDACLVLCGCFPQAFEKEASEILEPDVITGTSSRKILPALVAEFERTGKQVIRILPHKKNAPFEALEAVSFAERTRAYLKIQDGCQRRCAYCIIPDARGDLRSKPFEELKTELQELACMGYLEVVLVGINLSMYGIQFGKSLADAVKAAQETDGILRIRLGSLEPDLLTDDLLSQLADCDKLCPQFHIALQSGCDATLKRMKRHYTTQEYADLAARIRHFFPKAALTTDVMVGFAGESKEDFETSARFVEEIGFAKVHVFPYSIRPSTPAAAFENQVPEAEKARRSKEMIQRANKVRSDFLHQKIGQTEWVLIERVTDGISTGHTADYTPVILKSEETRNTLVKVRIDGVTADGCIAAKTE